MDNSIFLFFSFVSYVDSDLMRCYRGPVNITSMWTATNVADFPLYVFIKLALNIFINTFNIFTMVNFNCEIVIRFCNKTKTLTAAKSSSIA